MEGYTFTDWERGATYILVTPTFHIFTIAMAWENWGRYLRLLKLMEEGVL